MHLLGRKRRGTEKTALNPPVAVKLQRQDVLAGPSTAALKPLEDTLPAIPDHIRPKQKARGTKSKRK